MSAVGHAPTRDLAGRGDVVELVRAFYRDVAVDDLLGPVFAAVHVDWPSHLATLVDFWSWQLFGEPGYEGQPLLAHREPNAVVPFTPAHYDRWLELFESTVDERFAGPVAEHAKHRARKMASALERLLGAQPRCPIGT